MIRISWPLGIVLAFTIAMIARRPRLLPFILVIYGIWFLVETARRKDRR
jgi:hypothetical protein